MFLYWYDLKVECVLLIKGSTEKHQKLEKNNIPATLVIKQQSPGSLLIWVCDRIMEFQKLPYLPHKLHRIERKNKGNPFCNACILFDFKMTHFMDSTKYTESAESSFVSFLLLICNWLCSKLGALQLSKQYAC